MDLARHGRRVVLVSQDRTFAAAETLHPQLSSEVEQLDGSVELVRDLGKWLPTLLPWPDVDLKEAAARARDAQVRSWLTDWDVMQQLLPERDDLNLPAGTTDLRVEAIEFDGALRRIDTRSAPGHRAWVTYDIGVIVDVAADMPAAAATQPGFQWDSVHIDHTQTATVTGQIPMIATLGVFFDGDEDSLDSLAFRPRIS